MEENQKSSFQASLIPGVYLGIALIVFSIILYLLDVPYDSKLTWISYLIMAAGLFWAMISIRDNSLGGYLTYGQGFGIGFWTVFFSTILGTIFTYFYATMINPGIIEEILINSEEAILESSPDMSDEALEQALTMTEKFTTPVMLTVLTFVFSMIFGTILSLIIAIFAKREDKSLA